MRLRETQAWEALYRALSGHWTVQRLTDRLVDGIPDQVWNAYNRALSGQRLNDDQRRQFVQSADQVAASARSCRRPPVVSWWT